MEGDDSMAAIKAEKGEDFMLVIAQLRL